MKTIVLIRHAHSPSSGYSDDDLRPISEKGRREHQKLCYALKEEKIFPTRIMTSPLKRAEESAEIMGEFFDLPIELVPAFDGEHSTDEMCAILTDLKEGEVVYVITHLPCIQRISKRYEPEKNRMSLPTSGAVLLNIS